MDFVLSMLVYFCLFFIFVFLFTVHLLVAMCTLIMMGKKKKNSQTIMLNNVFMFFGT